MEKGTCSRRKATSKRSGNAEREKAKRHYVDEDGEKYINKEIREEEDEHSDQDNDFDGDDPKNKEDEWQLARQYLTNERNPFFLARLRSDRRRHLHVPNEVIKDFNLKLPRKMCLIDPHGRKWEAHVMKWKDGRIWITGWKQVCKWNNVTHSDTCVCEIFEGTGNIQVYIARGGLERKG